MGLQDVAEPMTDYKISKDTEGGKKEVSIIQNYLDIDLKVKDDAEQPELKYKNLDLPIWATGVDQDISPHFHDEDYIDSNYYTHDFDRSVVNSTLGTSLGE